MDMNKANNNIIIYQSEDGKVHLDVKYNEETLWLTQQQLCELYQTSKSNVSEHIKHIFEDGELMEGSVVRKFRTTANDSKQYEVNHYNLDMILAMTRMNDWVAKLDSLLSLSGRQLLAGPGKVSHEEACRKAIAEFREYRRREMIQYESDFDRAVRELTDSQGEFPFGGNV